jgi:hypothetical protein
MPWQEVSIVDQRREFVRLAMQEGVNRRELCRRFGIHPVLTKVSCARIAECRPRLSLFGAADLAGSCRNSHNFHRPIWLRPVRGANLLAQSVGCACWRGEMLRIASVSCALCAIAMLLLAPFEAAARSGGAGFGARSFHSRAHFRVHRHYPSYGGVAAFAPYDTPDFIGSAQLVGIASPPREPVRVPMPVLTCRHSEQTVTVASEDGGTREIRITRC